MDDVGSPGPEPVTVATDGGPSSAAAVRWAAELAVSRGRELRLVHCAPFLRAPTGAGLHQRARCVLERARRLARRVAPDLPVGTALLPVEPVPGLLAEAENSALLVLGVDVLPGPEEEARALFRTARCPVLVVDEPDGTFVPVDGRTGRAAYGPC